MTTHQYQDIRLPQSQPKRGPLRWVFPIAAGFAGLLLGYGVAAGGDAVEAGSGSADCVELSGEYAALVSEGLDAGLSMDESRMADVAEKRDDLRERIENSCG